MASKDIRTNIEVTADTRDATDNLGDVERAAKDAEDAAKAIGDTPVDVDTSSAVADLSKVETASSDAEAAIKGVGDTPVEVNTSSARDDIEKLQAEMRQIREDGGKPIEVQVDTDKARQGLDKVHDSADKSHDVLAGMVGGSTAELGQLGGVAGTAGESLGQLAEAAANGELSMAGLAATALPLVAVAAAVKGISGHLQKVAETKAWETAEVDAYTKAIEGGASAAEALLARLKETGEIKLQVFSDQVDLVPILAQLGLSVEDFGKLVTGTKEQTEAWRTSMHNAGADSGQLNLVISAAQQNAELLEQAQKNAAVSTQVFGDNAADAAPKVRDFSADTLDAKNAAQDASDAVAALDAKVRLLLGGINDEQAWLNLKGHLETATSKMNDATASADEQRLAYLDAQEALLNYVEDLGTKIPTEKKTKIIAEIDEGEFRIVEAQLALLEKSRYPVYTPVFRNGSEVPRVTGSSVGGTSTGTASSEPAATTRGAPAQQSTTSSVRGVPSVGTVIINMPRTADGQTVTAAVRDWTRVDGDQGQP